MDSVTRVTPRNEDLFDLVRSASSGYLALPQFQRSFVWEPENVNELLLSILKGYFIGSLLVMEIDRDDPPFAIRAIEGSNLEEQQLDSRAIRLLLDGQQRITSLHYAFYSPRTTLKGKKVPTHFFLNLDEFILGNFDNALFYEHENEKISHMLVKGDWQFEERILPLPELLHWSEWEGAYSVWLAKRNVEELQNWTLQTKSIWDSKINNVFKFQASVLTLPRVERGNQSQLEEICTVFEKLNSSGVSLTVYDLLTARLHPRKVFLDILWQRALEENDLFPKFAGDDPSTYGVLVLRCIGLMRGVDIKSKALVNLGVDNFVEDWNKAVKYIEAALERLISLGVDGFGVFDIKWLPSITIIPVLAALLAKRDALTDVSQKALATSAIQAWYWTAVFTERFTGPVETVTQRDFSELSRYFVNIESVPEIFQIAKIALMNPDSAYTLLDVARRGNTVYRAVMCLLALQGAKDFQVNESISYQRLEDHHIFPKAYLSKNYTPPKGISPANIANTILNRTLISQDTNRAIRAKSPSEYLRDASLISQANRDAILEHHFIDHEGLNAMLSDDYESFLIRREELILGNLRERLKKVPALQQ